MIKKRREKELAELKKFGESEFEDKSAGQVRLANRVAKGMTIDPRTGTATQGND